MTRQFRLDEEFTLWELIQMSRLVQMAVIIIICMKKSELYIIFVWSKFTMDERDGTPKRCVTDRTFETVD
jgi:hypothetical protein